MALMVLDLANPQDLVSLIVPTSYRLVAGPHRPHVDVTHRDGVQHWLV